MKWMALFGFWRKYWGRTDKAPEWRPPENGRSGDEDRQAGRYQFVYRFVPLFAQPIRMPQPGDLQQDLENSVGKIKSSNEISKNSRINPGKTAAVYSWALLDYWGSAQAGKPKEPCLFQISEPEAFDPAQWGTDIIAQFRSCGHRPGKFAAQCRFALPCGVTVYESLPRIRQYGAIAACAEAVLRQFPGCIGIYWPHSRNLVSREFYQRQGWHSPEFRFLDSGLHVRAYRVGGSGGQLFDTLGLSAIGLPDLQCRCSRLEPGHVMNYLRSIAEYLYQNGDEICDGETFEGVDGSAWPCAHRQSLVGPLRRVLDISPAAQGQPAL